MCEGCSGQSLRSRLKVRSHPERRHPMRKMPAEHRGLGPRRRKRYPKDIERIRGAAPIALRHLRVLPAALVVAGVDPAVAVGWDRLLQGLAPGIGQDRPALGKSVAALGEIRVEVTIRAPWPSRARRSSRTGCRGPPAPMRQRCGTTCATRRRPSARALRRRASDQPAPCSSGRRSGRVRHRRPRRPPDRRRCHRKPFSPCRSFARRPLSVTVPASGTPRSR